MNQPIKSPLNLETVNRWREAYNPLRGLTMARAVSLAEAYFRGILADYQWTCFFIEQTDADLMALIERRLAALMEMDWNVKTVATESQAEEDLAKEQADFLEKTYNAIPNLYEAIEHLDLAIFRGYAHVQKPLANRPAMEILDPWNVVRDGMSGRWKYNPQATVVGWNALPDTNILDENAWLIRTVRRPINRIALFKFIRQNLSQKDWDAFIEIFGLPGCVVIGPPNVPPGKEAEYRDSAEDVSEGASGYLPNGSDVKFSDSPRGVSPFRDHLSYLTEKLILAGTGGLLTMLTAPTGLGKGPSEEHADVFEAIARSDARRVSEVFQAQSDVPLLAAQFPGQKALAYFEMASNEETDVGAIVDHALKLSQAGYRMDAEQLAEKTGYKITLIQAPAAMPAPDTIPVGGSGRLGEASLPQNADGARGASATDFPAPTGGTGNSEPRTLNAGPSSPGAPVSAGSASSLSDAEFLAEMEKQIQAIPDLLAVTAEKLATPLEKRMAEAVNGVVKEKTS